jgi:predicted enzyme related to lactoylglutathione lyase
MPRVVHFEIYADQPDRAVSFYSQVFGWQNQKWAGPQDYWLLTTGDDKQPGINGGLLKRRFPEPGTDGPIPTTVNSIEVASVDEFSARVADCGGTVVVPKMAIPGVGYVAYCQDTEGNLFGLFQSDSACN